MSVFALSATELRTSLVVRFVPTQEIHPIPSCGRHRGLLVSGVVDRLL